MKLTMADDARYTCEIGDFYKIFAQRDDSWEFKAGRILKEEELAGALEVLKMLKSGKGLEARMPVE